MTYAKIRVSITTFITKQIGMPSLKELCFVLWRKVCIPSIAPGAPKNIATEKSTFSGILLILFLEKNLSAPNIIKLAIFITTTKNNMFEFDNWYNSSSIYPPIILKSIETIIILLDKNFTVKIFPNIFPQNRIVL